MSDNPNNPNNIEVGDLFLTQYSKDTSVTILAEVVEVYTTTCRAYRVCASVYVAGIAENIFRRLDKVQKLNVNNH